LADVTVVGMEELGRRAAQFSDKMQKDAIRKAANAGAAVLQKAIRTAAPVRKDERPMGSKARMPGYLKAHISRRGQALREGSILENTGPLKSAYYAKIQEYGTSTRSAHPFMRNAFESHVKEAEDAFAKTLTVEIDNFFKR